MEKNENNLKSGFDFFKPKARLLVLLGEQLIANEIIAIVELIKNAYDADANTVNIFLENINNPEQGKITILDNGYGMDLDTILNVWLEPGTEYRLLEREKNIEERDTDNNEDRKKRKTRIKLGEKGVGRFAVHKLGRVIELVTRTEKIDYEIVLNIDWTTFERGYLNEIPVKWKKRQPLIFKDKKHGTSIIVEKLRKQWSNKDVRQLNEKIVALNSPFEEENDFNIQIEAPGFEKELESLPKISEIRKKAIYKIEGSVDMKGFFDYSYQFFNPEFSFLKRDEDKKKDDVKNPIIFQNDRLPTCGPFNIKLYVWDLDPATLKETVTRTYYQKFIKPHSGIRIYRDEFRVWSFGEQDDDSFELDARRVNNPTLRISRNQIIGIIEITNKDNPELRDKTNREGLIENIEYNDFKNLVIGCLSVFEVERRKDKDKIDRLREKKKPGDEIHKELDLFKDQIEKNGHSELYQKNINRIKSLYDKKIQEVLEPLLVSAGLGIAYTIPVHEISRNLFDLNELLNQIHNIINNKNYENINKKFLQIHQMIDVTDDLVRGIGKITRKGKPEIFSLDSVVNDAIDISKSRLLKNKILISISEKDRTIKIRGIKNMVITALLNLIDNSAYWLLHRTTDRSLLIKINHNHEGKPRIIVCDNGPGIKDDPSLLVQPFFTRKPDGMGLGLYIVERIMKAHGGQIEFLFEKDEQGLLEGANAALVFPKESEERK